MRVDKRVDKRVRERRHDEESLVFPLMIPVGDPVRGLLLTGIFGVPAIFSLPFHSLS